MASSPPSPHMFDKFYLLTVPHGRKGAIPYEYPSAAATAADASSPKLPRPTEVINFCFPDLDDLRKTRSLDFKGPLAPPQASTLGVLGAQVTQIGEKVGVVGVGGPAAPPALGGGGSSSTSSSYSVASPAPGALGSGVSNVAIASSSSSNFRAEFYTFTLTEADGTRIFGVVYRCLPSGFGMRYDVGKRYPECLCILTRYPQAQSMFQQVLQQVHALRLMYAPIARIESLLGELYHHCLPSPGETLMLKQTPVGTEHAARAYRYTWPAEGEVPTGDALATLYLFQQLKPKPFILLLSAMLCEHRICFIASDMDKLSACVHAAVGLLYPFTWQHVFIPVLPPSLLSYASTPGPIIFGLRRQHLSSLPPSPLNDELIYVDLDAGELSWSGPGPCPVPDFYVLPNTSQVVQAAQKLGAEAAKAAEKLDKAFNKGVAFLQKYTGQQPSKEMEEPKPDAANILAWELSLLGQSRASYPIAWPSKSGGAGAGAGGGGGKPATVKSILEKSVLNEEQQLRDALLIFYVNLVGDASTHLRPDRAGTLKLDKDFYIGSRGMLGDGAALSHFLLELVQTHLFERLAETRKGQMAAEMARMGSPRAGAGGGGMEGGGPFFKCVEVVKARGETFSVSNIKKALKAQAQQQQQQAVAAAAEATQQGGLSAEAEQVSGRWTVFHEAALQLTSGSGGGAAPADAQRALHQLVEDAYSSTLLPSILRVVWTRLGDCKGLKWKHAHKSLLLLRELLLRGPESVFSDTLSNVTVLRTFLEYKAGGLGGGGREGGKVREVAHGLLFLLLDGRQFMLQRAVYWAGKKKMCPPGLRLSMEHALSSSFTDLHQALAPTASAPSSSSLPSSSSSSLSTSLGKSGAPPPDLLSSGSEQMGGGGSGDDNLMPLTDASAFAAEEVRGGEGQQEQQQQQQQEPALLRHDSSSSSFTRSAPDMHSTTFGAQPPKPQWETFAAADTTTSPTPSSLPPSSSSSSPPASQWESFPKTFSPQKAALGVLPSDALAPIQPTPIAAVVAQQQQQQQQQQLGGGGNPFGAVQSSVVPAYDLPMGTTGAGARILSPTSSAGVGFAGGMMIGGGMGGGMGGGGGLMSPAVAAYDPFAEIEKGDV